MTTGPYTRKSARAAAFHAIFLRVPAQVATLLGYVILVRFLTETEFGVVINESVNTHITTCQFRNGPTAVFGWNPAPTVDYHPRGVLTLHQPYCEQGIVCQNSRKSYDYGVDRSAQLVNSHKIIF